MLLLLLRDCYFDYDYDYYTTTSNYKTRTLTESAWPGELALGRGNVVSASEA